MSNCTSNHGLSRKMRRLLRGTRTGKAYQWAIRKLQGRHAVRDEQGIWVDSEKPGANPVKLPRKIKKRLQDELRRNSCEQPVYENGRFSVRQDVAMSRTWQRHEIVILAVGARPGRPWGIRYSLLTPKQFETLRR